MDDPPSTSPPQIDWEVPVEIAGEIRAAVPVNDFFKHTSALHADGDIGFSREYEAIQSECVSDDLPSEHSQHPDNKRKNRYLNIIACKLMVFMFSIFRFILGFLGWAFQS